MERVIVVTEGGLVRSVYSTLDKGSVSILDVDLFTDGHPVDEADRIDEARDLSAEIEMLTEIY